VAARNQPHEGDVQNRWRPTSTSDDRNDDFSTFDDMCCLHMSVRVASVETNKLHLSFFPSLLAPARISIAIETIQTHKQNQRHKKTRKRQFLNDSRRL
jgi:hypothetical protein